MCQDHETAAMAVEAGMSRRRFLQATAGAAAATTLFRRFPRLPLRSADRAVTADGTSAYSLAMHVHSSFSEYDGSMEAQLFQAASNAVDVLWWTDHDWRMDGLDYRRTVHFTSLTAEKPAAGEGGTWHWTTAKSGPHTAQSGGGIVNSPSSPNDPVDGGSMHLTAKSSTTVAAKYGYYADSQPADYNYRDNLTGQSLAVDVLLTSSWTEGYLELLIASSFHAPAGGQPGGDYSLSYRFVPAGGTASRVANGVQGIITVPVTPGGGANPWTTVTVTPSDDIQALWPALDYRDFSLYELTLSAVSTGDLVDGYFDYLRFTRDTGGEAFFQQQAEMASALAPSYSSVAQHQGLEVSWQEPHMNWFGGNVAPPDYGGVTRASYTSYLQNYVIPAIHSSGGLVSYNHPYGSGNPPALPASQQDALLTQVATALLPTAALQADLIEVGYHLRQGVDLAHHVALWDVMSRNAVFLTGNGTNDDHFGQNWRGIGNNWFSSTWAASTTQADLLAALAAGRAWCGSLSEYRGSLDMLVDGSCPMGSVSVSRVASRQLVATAAGIPTGGSLQVLQGAVDYAGTAAPAANTEIIAAYSAAELGGGSVTRSIDTTEDSFVRMQVVTSSGSVVGVSNPLWLLRNPPPGGIPSPRAA